MHSNSESNLDYQDIIEQIKLIQEKICSVKDNLLEDKKMPSGVNIPSILSINELIHEKTIKAIFEKFKQKLETISLELKTRQEKIQESEKEHKDFFNYLIGNHNGYIKFNEALHLDYITKLLNKTFKGTFEQFKANLEQDNSYLNAIFQAEWNVMALQGKNKLQTLNSKLIDYANSVQKTKENLYFLLEEVLNEISKIPTSNKSDYSINNFFPRDWAPKQEILNSGPFSNLNTNLSENQNNQTSNLKILLDQSVILEKSQSLASLNESELFILDIMPKEFLLKQELIHPSLNSRKNNVQQINSQNLENSLKIETIKFNPEDNVITNQEVDDEVIILESEPDVFKLNKISNTSIDINRNKAERTNPLNLANNLKLEPGSLKQEPLNNNNRLMKVEFIVNPLKHPLELIRDKVAKDDQVLLNKMINFLQHPNNKNFLDMDILEFNSKKHFFVKPNDLGIIGLIINLAIKESIDIESIMIIVLHVLYTIDNPEYFWEILAEKLDTQEEMKIYKDCIIICLDHLYNRVTKDRFEEEYWRDFFTDTRDILFSACDIFPGYCDDLKESYPPNPYCYEESLSLEVALPANSDKSKQCNENENEDENKPVQKDLSHLIYNTLFKGSVNTKRKPPNENEEDEDLRKKLKTL